MYIDDPELLQKIILAIQTITFDYSPIYPTTEIKSLHKLLDSEYALAKLTNFITSNFGVSFSGLQVRGMSTIQELVDKIQEEEKRQG